MIKTSSVTTGGAATHIIDIIAYSLDRQKRALIVWSGGRTPRLMVPALASSELDWTRVTFLMGDERWVPLEDARSNEGEMRRYTAGTPLEAARIQGLYAPGLSAEDGAARATEQLGDLLAEPACCSLLGIGEDGHIASLFPGGDWTRAPNDVYAVAAAGPPDTPARVSLTPVALFRSRHWLVIVNSAGKRAMWDKAAAGAAAADVPAAIALAPGAPPVTLVGG